MTDLQATIGAVLCIVCIVRGLNQYNRQKEDNKK